GLVEPADRILEAIPPDEPHRVERPAIGRVSQAVDRDDPGMLQAPGHLGLELESGAVLWVVGISVLDLLEGHVAIQLRIERAEGLPQSTFGVRPEEAEPSARGRRTADRDIGDGAVWIVVFIRSRAGDQGEARPDVRVGDAGQLVADLAQRAEAGQALL